jgi:hypothetical protein
VKEVRAEVAAQMQAAATRATFSLVAGGRWGFEFKGVLKAHGLTYSKSRKKWWITGLSGQQVEELERVLREKTQDSITITKQLGDYDPLEAPPAAHPVRHRWKASANDMRQVLGAMEAAGEPPEKVAIVRGAIATLSNRAAPDAEKRKALKEVAELRGVFDVGAAHDGEERLRAMTAGEILALIHRTSGGGDH